MGMSEGMFFFLQILPKKIRKLYYHYHVLGPMTLQFTSTVMPPICNSQQILFSVRSSSACRQEQSPCTKDLEHVFTRSLPPTNCVHSTSVCTLLSLPQSLSHLFFNCVTMFECIDYSTFQIQIWSLCRNQIKITN